MSMHGWHWALAWVCVTGLAGGAEPAAGEAAGPAAAAVARPRPPDPSLAPIQDTPGLPRVLLIGDSISMGYTLPLRGLLAGQANVHRIPENGGPTSRGVAALERWLGDGRWDVIQINWGLHDLRRDNEGRHQVPIADYEKNLRALVARLKTTGAALIWCATTPVPEGNLRPPRSNADVIAYNAVALRVMQDNGVIVNDLYSFALPRLSEIQQPVNVHFTPAGYRVLAEAVAPVISAALASRRAP